MRFCNIEDCPCHNVKFGDFEDVDCQVLAIEDKNEKKKNEMEDEEGTNKFSLEKDTEMTLAESVYSILTLTLRNMCRRDFIAGSEIIQAYINHYKLKNMFKALYNLMLAEEASISFFQEFLLFCLRKSIEIYMQEEKKETHLS